MMADWQTIPSRQPRFHKYDEESPQSTFAHAWLCIPPVYKQAATRFAPEIKTEWDNKCREDGPDARFRMNQEAAKTWMKTFVPMWLDQRLEEARQEETLEYETTKARLAELYEAEIERLDAERKVLDLKYTRDVVNAQRKHQDCLHELR